MSHKCGYFLRLFFEAFFFFLVEPTDFFIRLAAVEPVGFFFTDLVVVRPNAATQPSAYFVVEPVRRILTSLFPLLQGAKQIFKQGFTNRADPAGPDQCLY